jgi:hypothetical protein
MLKRIEQPNGIVIEILEEPEKYVADLGKQAEFEASLKPRDLAKELDDLKAQLKAKGLIV